MGDVSHDGYVHQGQTNMTLDRKSVWVLSSKNLLDIMDVHTPEIEHQHGCGLKPWYPDGTRMVP